MSANRDELIHLIAGMPDDQVDALLANARHLASGQPRGEWPPAGREDRNPMKQKVFGAGVAKDGRADIARNAHDYLAEGFGRRRS